MSSVLIQEIDKVEQPVFFVSKMFKGIEAQYQKIEKLTLEMVVITGKLRPYFSGHYVMVKTGYLIFQVLKKLDLVGRMVSWVVELSEYDIQYIFRGNIKSHVLANVLVEFSLPVGKES